MLDPVELGSRLAGVRERIARAAGRVRRDPADIRLVAISKTFPAADVRSAAAAGQLDFGENKVQEALAKIEQTADLPLRWHLVGHLQSNKARKAAASFSAIHSIDTAALITKLDVAAQETGRPIELLIQVDLAGEPTKHGASPEDLLAVIEPALQCKAARLTGLMLLPPAMADPEATRPYFAALRRLRDDLVAQGIPPLCLAQLSMGMSRDFEVAIEEGATLVRVGSSDLLAPTLVPTRRLDRRYAPAYRPAVPRPIPRNETDPFRRGEPLAERVLSTESDAMNVSPLDLRQQRFRSAFRGFDRVEVTSFLLAVADDYEHALRETDRLQQDISRMEAVLNEHREHERSLKSTLMAAQKLADDIKANAEQEARRIVAEAEGRSELLLEKSELRFETMQREIDGLKLKRKDVETSLTGTIQTLRHALEYVREQDARERDDKILLHRPRHVEAAPASEVVEHPLAQGFSS